MSKKIQTYTNNHDYIPKSPTIASVMPEFITECAVYLNRRDNEPCSDSATLAVIAEKVKLGLPENTLKIADPQGILDAALEQTGCTTEKCVIQKLAPERIGIIETHFKLDGPTDITLLNNFNIDKTLKQFQVRFPEFYAYNFNMLNYREYSFRDGYIVSKPDTLETVPVASLIANYKCAGCVINTDTYQGSGKHWMALFADWRDPSSATVEFFNSSGNAPHPAWILWMERSRDALIQAGMKIRTVKYAGFDSDLFKVTNKRHQQSMTECGVYSLFYIYARLQGIKPEFFNENFIYDQWIFEFRQHLFGGDNAPFAPFAGSANKFDWNIYNKKVKVKWEQT